MSNRVHALLGLLAVVGASVGASAAPIEAVYLNATVAPAPSPWSAVPGAVTGSTDPRFTNFGNMTRSTDGKTWCVVASMNFTPTTIDQIYFTGVGLVGTNRAQEGVTAFATSPTTELFANFATMAVNPPRTNAADQWAVGFRLNVTGATNADDRLVFVDGANYTVIRPGDQVPALPPGTVYNGSFGSAHITENGQAGFLALVSPNTAASADNAFTGSGATQLVEIGVTTPTGQQTMTPAPWSDIDSNTFQVSGDGSRWIALGEVGFVTATDKVAVVDGAVVVQEGFPVAGVPGPVTSISIVRMEAGGDWFIRGTSTTTDTPPVSTVWWLRNGSIIAQQGQPIVPGSTELWGSVIQEARGDNSGNYAVNGRTNNADGTLNDVIVYNGKKIVARESDPVSVDVTGDAVPETFYLHTFESRCALLNDDFFYMATVLKNGPAGTALGNANILRIRVCRADFNSDAVVSIDDLFLYFNAYFTNDRRADMNGIGGVTIDDLFLYINFYFVGC